METPEITLWLILCAFTRLSINGQRAEAYVPENIPIGAILGKESRQVETAVRYKIKQFNGKKGSDYLGFKVEASLHSDVNVDNPNEFIGSMCDQMNKGIFAFIGSSHLPAAASAFDFAEKFHMPYFTTSRGGVTSLRKHFYSLHMLPDHLDAIIDVMLHYKWTDYIYYIFDDEDGFGRLSYIYKRLEELGQQIPIAGAKLNDTNNAYAELRMLDNLPQRFANKKIILDMSSHSVLKKVLEQISIVGMNKHGYHYILGTLAIEELNLTQFRHGGVNITGFSLLNYTYYELDKFIEDWAKPPPEGTGMKTIELTSALFVDSISVITKSLNTMMINKKDVFSNIFRDGALYNNGTRGIKCFSRYQPTPWIHGPGIIEAIKTPRVAGLSGEIVFDAYGKRINYSMDVLEVSLDSGPIKIGDWSKENGFLTNKLGEGLEDKKPNVTATRTIQIITTVLAAPYVMMRKPEPGQILTGVDRYEGYCVELAKLLSEVVPFNYTIKIVEDGQYGTLDSNGRWDGMVGELTRQTADMAIAPLTIKSMRERVVDFSKPFMRTGISVMIKKPEKQKPGVFSFMDPLDREIWMSITFAFVGVSIVMFLVSRISPYEWNIVKNNGDGMKLKNAFTLKNSMWFSFGALMQQGTDDCPSSVSGRLVGSAWWFFTLIIISSYTANLAAFLTIESMVPPVNSAEELANQVDIKYGTMEKGSTYDFFKSSKMETYKKMFKFMSSQDPKDVFVRDNEEGVKKVQNSKGKYAYLVESTTNEYHNQRKPCDTMKVGANLDSKGYGVATYQGHPLRDAVNLAILKMHEDGTLTKLKQKWWYDKGECGSSSDSKTNELTLSNVAGIFYILIGGLALAMLVSLCEFLYNSRQDSIMYKKSFKDTARTQARLSISGRCGMGGKDRSSFDNSSAYGVPYAYTAPNGMITFRGYDEKTDTEV
ncbi:glutamate receptor 4 [Lingula anatina]|uniref:Glutamate receptor 4 n=1 Tax=Lingula anatina TaxID=7574 RepID=A0A1S3I492_LINAN|nr:glutamate receptor 4 [Lingula anatina]|eukprot:XP_013392184.1 glutamate receptor 4 [Lingula anatina]